MQQGAGATERAQRVAELRREEASLHKALAGVAPKPGKGATALSLAMREARTRELATVAAKLQAFGETPKAAGEGQGDSAQPDADKAGRSLDATRQVAC